MKSEILDNGFVTTNTALAAYLQSQGFPLLRVDVSNPRRCAFIFANSDPLQQLVQDFEVGTATGNIPMFWVCYKNLLMKVKL